MNGELLSVLDHIEREKGVKKEILIAAVESALVSAARRTLGREDDITVEIDKESGQIKVMVQGKEVESPNFGRIAAQTAKQVIIQKIREAERDVVYQTYLNRIGTLANGSVHRFERGDIIVDLGKTEAVIPKRELSSKETYRQGDRIRGYILDVRRSGKSPQVVLSRTHPGIVRRLFEMEVPEIQDGIVEIKSVAREAGERIKIAVYSKDKKVDCIGACVGMRGGRVKEIVRELQGEKIDIVRYSEDTKEYIAGAMSPAEVVDVLINKEKKSVDVVVEDDQLSLAIGKRGQNVRLASRLTGWDIDIKAKSTLAAKREEAAALLGIKRAPEGEEAFTLREIEGVGAKTELALKAANFTTVESIANSSIEALTEVKGIGKKTAEKILASAKGILQG